MIVAVSARCERLLPCPPRVHRGGPVHLASATRTSTPCHPDIPPRPGFSKPSFTVSGAVLGAPPGPAPAPGARLTLAYSAVENFARNVDGEAAETFFHAQAVDGISAGRRASER